MGITDRDYIRSKPRPAGVGSVRVVSVNTWIIIINVAVFVLNNFVFQGVYWDVAQQRQYLPGVGSSLIERAEPDKSQMRPRADGTFVRPLVVTAPDGSGRRVQVGREVVQRMPIIEAFGHFSTGKFWSDGQVWRLITFQFLHANIWHIVFNMLGLWFVGGLVEQYLGARRYAVYYLTCGVFGALTYLLLNLAGYLVMGATGAAHSSVPFLLFENPYTPLIGASAGVFGVLMAAAYIAPDATVDVMMFLPMRLQTAVYIFLALAVVNLFQGGHNAGGDAAHVGGAAAGAFFIRRPHLLRDILAALWLHKGPRRGDPAPVPPRSEREAVEQILAKISRDGLHSLSESERAVLKRAARE